MDITWPDTHHKTPDLLKVLDQLGEAESNWLSFCFDTSTEQMHLDTRTDAAIEQLQSVLSACLQFDKHLSEAKDVGGYGLALRGGFRFAKRQLVGDSEVCAIDCVHDLPTDVPLSSGWRWRSLGESVVCANSDHSEFITLAGHQINETIDDFKVEVLGFVRGNSSRPAE